MSAKRNDISQIRKYLKGELDARAMHELEKKALNDPFLMDALEGYGKRHNNQQTHLKNLHGRLQQRIASSEKRFRLWPAMAVAAAVLLFITVGGLWLSNYYTKQQKFDLSVADHTNVITKPAATAGEKPLVKKDSAVLKPVSPSIAETSTPSVAADLLVTDPRLKVTGPKGKIEVQSLPDAKRGYASLHKKETVNSEIIIDEAVGNAMVKQADPEKDVAASSAEIRIRGIATPPDTSSTLKIISGQVLAGANGSPVPGAMVTIAGKNTSTLTDANGRFSVRAANKDELNIAYIGYQGQKLKVKGNDSLKVTLKENQNALSEVVVVGYGTQQVINEAHPASGWDSFNHYLEDKAHSTDGKTGIVQLLFSVNPDNSLSDFKIIKSLSTITDQHAIDLIKWGPSWIHNRNGKPETIKVKIVFKD